MHRPSWWRRSKKLQAKAAAIPRSNSSPLASSVSLSVITPGPGPSDASSVPQSNGQSRDSLWDKAYESLRADKKDLVDLFEKLLLSELEIQSTSTVVDGDLSIREKQMSALVAKKLETMKQEQWRVQMGQKTIEVRQQVDRIVKVVELGKDFITSVARMDPIHAGLPWAGVCMLLPLITKDSEQRTAATDGLEYISGLISRYTQVEQIYLGDEDFPLKGDLQSSMTKVYRHVLEYEARAACQFSRRTAHQWARNVIELDSWKTIIGTIKDLEAACDNLRWIIDAKDQRVRTSRLESYLERQSHEVQELVRVTQAQEEEQGKRHLAELKAGRKEQNDWHRNEEESACYECLRTTDYESNKNRNPERIPGTCEWFLHHPRYRKWLDEQGSTWLWVTADPGCGKSVLSRFLIEEYKKGLPYTNPICYYFFKDNSEEGRSATHALCAILHQLFSQNNKLLRHAIPEYKRNGSKLPGLFNELWDIFISAAADPEAGSVVCILDALDECAQSTRLPLMRKLANFCLNPTLGTRLKFIIVSRPYASIHDTFWEEYPKVDSIHLMGESEDEMEAIRVEIDLVIEDRVKQFNHRRRHKGVEDDAHIAVQEELRNIENRTYLWVALIFPELERKAGLAKSKLLQLIKNIPKSVDEAYERILSHSSDIEQARKLLHIVVTAKRPLNLTEMNIALSMKEGACSLEDLELEPESSFQTTVRDLCGLFVAIRDSTVFLIHQTAKEFLVAENTSSKSASVVLGSDSWRHSLEPAMSNHVLAKICISYLSFDAFESNPLVLEEENDTSTEDKEDREEKHSVEDDQSNYNSEGSMYAMNGDDASTNSNTIDDYIARHPFLEYAACNWALHLRETESLDDPATMNAALMICTSHSNRLQTWFGVYQVLMEAQPMSENVTDLMIGSHFGLEEMVKSCLAQGAQIDAKDTALGWTPLVFAVSAGHEAIVKMLLESNADLNIQDKYGDTALMDAAIKGYETVVEMLLESNADPNTQSCTGLTALMGAAYWGHETTVKMLLQSNAEPNIQDMYGRTALMDAAYRGNETMVKMFLELGVGSKIKNDQVYTALHSMKRRKEDVNEELQKETDPTKRDGLLDERNRLQAVEDILLEHEAKLTKTSMDDDESSDTASTDTLELPLSRETSTHEEDPS